MSFNLTLSPPQAEFVASPGATIIQAYEITNTSDSNVYLNTSVEPFQASGADGNVSYLRTLPSDIQLSLNNADLKLGETFNLIPGQHRQIVLKIKINKDAALHDTYLTFFVNKLPTSSTDASYQSQVLAKLGSHILLSTSNQQNPSAFAQFDKTAASPRIKDVFLTPVKLSTTVTNTANYFFKTFGKLTITKNGKLQKEIQLQPLNVLSRSPRKLETSLNPPFWPGAYTATFTLDASASAASASTSFYVFPFSPLALTLLLAGVYLLVRRLRRASSRS